MKSINARTTLKLVLSFSWLIALAVVRPGYAGDYYIYQDPNGKLVISNNAPPPGSKIINKETLSEVTDQQIAESQVREDTAGFDNRLSSLENTIGELTENLRVQGEVINNVPEGYGDTNIAVGVTQGPHNSSKATAQKIQPPSIFLAQFAQRAASLRGSRGAVLWRREGRVKLCLFLIPATFG